MMKDLIKKLSKFEFLAMIIKGITGVVGGSLILEQNHPYITLTILALGAAANEYIMFIEKNKK